MHFLLSFLVIKISRRVLFLIGTKIDGIATLYVNHSSFVVFILRRKGKNEIYAAIRCH